MAFPTRLDTIRVYGTLGLYGPETGDTETADAVQGTITFTPSAVLVDVTENKVLFPDDTVVSVDADGNFEVRLAATNDPHLAPLNWSWTAKEDFTNAEGDSFTFQLDVDAPSGEVKYASLRGGGGGGGAVVPTYILLAEKGAPNGVASLDADQVVPSDQLGTGGLGTGTRILYDDQTFKPVPGAGPGGDPTLGGDLTGTASAAQIAAGAVGTSELAANAVTSAKIADGTITEADLSFTIATQDELDAHANTSTSVHGITNTANLVYTDDSRLGDERTPVDHATSHAVGGGDALSGNLDAVARSGTRINSGSTTYNRRRTNLVAGAGITLALAESVPNEESVVTITSTASGGTASWAPTPGFVAVAMGTAHSSIKTAVAALGGYVLDSDPVTNTTRLKAACDVAAFVGVGVEFTVGTSDLAMMKHPDALNTTTANTFYGCFFPFDGQIYKGQGAGKTVLRHAPGGTYSGFPTNVPGDNASVVFFNPFRTGTANDVKIMDMTIDGRSFAQIGASNAANKSYQSHGINTYGGSRYLIERVQVQDVRGTSGAGGDDETSFFNLYLGGYGVVRDCICRSTDGGNVASGFHLVSTTHVTLDHCHAYGNTKLIHGFPLWRGSDNRRINCYAERCTTSGFRHEFDARTWDLNCFATICGTAGAGDTGGFHFGGATNVRMDNCASINNLGAGLVANQRKEDPPGSGTFATSTNWRVTGCTFQGNGSPDINVLNEIVATPGTLAGGRFGWGSVVTTFNPSARRSDYERYNT